MGQQQQIIYVYGKGFIPIQSGQTVQDAIATAPQTREAAGVGTLGFEAGDEQFGLSLPPVPKGDAEQMLDAIPQLAGLLAQFSPLGKTYKGAAGVPAFVDMVMQLMQGGGDVSQIDPTQTALHAAGGVGGKAVGDVIGGVGQMGKDKILRSLNLSGDLKNEAAEEMLPRLAMRERAQMTKPGIQAIRDKAAATGAGGLEDLADAMGKSRLDAATAKTKTTFWPNELLSNFLNQPARQMALGQSMAQPFGVNTSETLAPVGEASVRAFMAWIASQLGESQAAPPAPPGGPRRRSQP
jgi:hypothetical protein